MRPHHIALTVLALFCPLQAEASILTYTYQGVVSSGVDTTGVFGTAGADLAGQMFTAVQTFDTDRFRYTNTDGATFSYQIGGSSYGAAAAGATGTIKIGNSAARSIGDTKDMTQNTVGTSTTSVENAHSFINAAGYNDFYEETLKFAAYSPSITFDYTRPFSVVSTVSVPPGDAAFSGSYALSAYVRDFSTGSTLSFDYANATLQPLSLTVTNTVSSVPLPASAPLFGVALLALAAAGRGMKRRTVAPTA